MMYIPENLNDNGKTHTFEDVFPFVVYCYVMSVSILEGKSTWEYHLQLFGGCPEFDAIVQW